jgi:hypothetical protein
MLSPEEAAYLGLERVRHLRLLLGRPAKLVMPMWDALSPEERAAMAAEYEAICADIDRLKVKVHGIRRRDHGDRARKGHARKRQARRLR